MKYLIIILVGLSLNACSGLKQKFSNKKQVKNSENRNLASWDIKRYANSRGCSVEMGPEGTILNLRSTSILNRKKLKGFVQRAIIGTNNELLFANILISQTNPFSFKKNNKANTYTLEQYQRTLKSYHSAIICQSLRLQN